MALFLPTTRPGGIVSWFDGRQGRGARLDGRRRCWGSVSGCNADFKHTAVSGARLALFVEQVLGLGRALLLLQAADFAERCTHSAAAFLADAVAPVGELLLLLFRELRFGLVHPIARVFPAARLLRVWRLKVWRITHRGTKYRRFPTKSRRSISEPKVEGGPITGLASPPKPGLKILLSKFSRGARRASQGVPRAIESVEQAADSRDRSKPQRQIGVDRNPAHHAPRSAMTWAHIEPDHSATVVAYPRLM
jgi:hypothetical protein